MKKFSAFVLLAALISTAAYAIPPCEATGCRTQTQGGWGNDCHGGNPGCYRDAHFAEAFPSGLTIGGTFTIQFSSANAIRIFLPAGSTGGSLTQNHTDPASTEAGVFAGQVTALALSLGFSDAGLPGFCDLGSLYYLSPIAIDGSPFSGMTVYELFDLANEVLGGNLANLPGGTTLSNLNDVITAINENYDNGTTDNGDLVCDIELAAELISFSAVARDGSIELAWATASESDVQRFEVERAVNGNWSVVGIVNGLGDSPVGHSYRFADENIINGTTYSYRLAELAANGNRSTMPNVVQVEAGIESALPTEFSLMQNYPNPFNPSTQISFSLPDASNVTLAVFDALGRNVGTLVKGTMAAGTHNVNFDAANLSNGIYFYQLKAGEFSAVRKMMLLK
ncbi:MAG: T9SS type A sorting domain-containing protein [bacterium]|nr:T9SS type A sorting domain-containing protein [bacterium]